MRFYAFFHYKPTTNTKVKDGKKNRMTMETPIEVYLKSAEILAPLCHLPRPAQTSLDAQRRYRLQRGEFSIFPRKRVERVHEICLVVTCSFMERENHMQTEYVGSNY
jgi:hypothetical protein